MTWAIQTRLRTGSATAILALMLPVILAVAAFAINVVYMELVRTELQIATDAATRAAGRTLAVTGSQQQALDAAARFLSLNRVGNQTLNLDVYDVVFGASTRTLETERYDFAPAKNANAIQISVNGKFKVPMLFPSMGVSVDFRPIKSAISTQTELDVALVLDRSGSMAFNAQEVAGNYKPAFAPEGWQFGQMIPPNSRWLDAVSSVQSFLELLSQTSQDERVGLVTYSGQAAINVTLTNSYPEIHAALDQHSLNFLGGGTNIGDGITRAASMLSDLKRARPWATRVMIVLTDGIWTVGTDPVLSAQVAASNDILIYTVTFSNEADQVRMRQIADIGLGKHFHASNSSELAAAFQQIQQSLPTLLTY